MSGSTARENLRAHALSVFSTRIPSCIAACAVCSGWFASAHRPMLAGKRIAFIVFNYPLGVSTMLINSIALLARGNRVDVLVSADEREALPVDAWMQPMLVTYPPFGRLLPVRAVIRRLERWLPRWLHWYERMPGWAVAYADLYLFARWLRTRIRRERYDILIPVECYSLVALDKAGAGAADVIYYNLELLDWSEGHAQYVGKRRLKQLEHRALERVAHVMVTSPERGRIFASLNGFPSQRISPLPVAPLGGARPARSRFFRDRLGITDERLLVVYAGNIEPWAQCLEIIESMDNWPPGAALVIHTWNRGAMSGSYFRSMERAAAGRPVFFSSDYLRYEELAPALASADIGLLFYQALDANFTEIL